MIAKPGYIIERKWYCPRWLFWRLKGYWSFWMTRTAVEHDNSVLEFLRGGPQGSDLELLAPGVRGKLFPEPSKNRIRIPMVYAENEGNGHIGLWLDSLSPAYVFVCVTSEVLIGMLLRRGWIPTWEQEADGFVDVWLQRKAIKVSGREMAPRLRVYSDWERQFLENQAIKKSMRAVAGK